MTHRSQPQPRRARVLASVILVAIGWLTSCRANNPVIVPNRVLDRPLDVVLACVRRNEDDTVDVLSLNTCDGAGTGDCDAIDEPQLVGFVANTETNEIGMFRRCDENGMVDLDPQAPGYNLVPVGSLPSRIVRTEDCRVVTANWGSCDLGAVDLPGLAAYAVGVTPDGAPSSLVTRIEPRRGDGTLLGALPGDIVAVPRELSLAEGGGGFESDAACDPDAPASVYVTFPTCQLVAEIDLSSQRILQSRQFVTDEDGVVSVIDTGPDPECPLECAEQFDEVPTDRPQVDSDGVFPIALALVRAEDSLSGAQDSLFVGGTGSDEIFQFDIVGVAGSTTSNAFVPPQDTRRLLLENPAGVQGIRVTPLVEIDGATHQFLYVIAGDGSTHVVDRAQDVNTLGVECDTQVDPALATSRACHEIDPGAQASAADRRPFAEGPGIRGPASSTITDWTFQTAPAFSEPNTTPFGSAGVVGIGVTSFGRVVIVVFGQYDQSEPTIASVDPLGLMSVEIRPHMLWPIVDPANGDASVFPLVDDEEPRRVLPAEDNPTQVLAPSLRRIDLAYTAEAVADTDADPDEQSEQDAIHVVLGEPDNEDRLGNRDGDAFYESTPVRTVVRDYRQWRNGQAWRLLWEGQIPATESATGRIQCDTPNPNTDDPDRPGEEAGTCHATADEPVRLIDEGAQFCDDGVLPGDKLVLFGCGNDDECGVGRRCLRDPSAGGSTSGICVSALAYENELEELRRACAPFITDPCGAPRREYVVTAATQTELAFAAIDIPPTTFQRDVCPVPTGEDNVLDPYGPKPAPPTGALECEARLTCALPPGEEAPSGGCASDDECDDLGQSNGAQYLCIEGVCRTPCEGGSVNCRQIVLPGPKCFAEFVRYAITLRNAFLVQLEPAASFLPQRVLADPETGQCREDPTVSNLLTSRLPLGHDEDATFELIPDCPPSEEASPGDPNPCRITAARGSSGGAVYHYFSYNTNPVAAVRFSNPFGTIVLDLVSLLDLATPIGSEILEDGSLRYFHWDELFTRFRRARIPRNYREEFTTPQTSGYQTFNDPVVVQNTGLTYPVRIVSAPELAAAYIVDAGGLGGVAGVRGQVMRVTIANSEIRADENFRVR